MKSKDVGFTWTIEIGQIFITIDEGKEIMQTVNREHTQPRYVNTSRPRVWIRSNASIVPYWM